MNIVRNRFFVFAIFLAIFVAVTYFFFGTLLPTTETKNLWFYSGIFMVLFSLLFIEPYYTSPKNVITNTIPLLLVFTAIRPTIVHVAVWYTAMACLLGLLILSLFSLALYDSDKSPDNLKNKLANRIKNWVVLVGQGKVLYSAVFGYFLLSNFSIQDSFVLCFFVIWFVVIAIDPKSLHNVFSIRKRKRSGEEIGEIFGVQSKKIFLAKLFDDRRSIKKFDVVCFRYSMQDAEGLVLTGIVFDTYLLNQEKWAKLLQLGNPTTSASTLVKNVVYKVTDKNECDKVSETLKVDSLVGVVVDGSNIGKIKFEYSKKVDDLQEGDLLELSVGKRSLFYQVVGGATQKERLEARNETGFVEGEAVQLGEWVGENLSFHKFGWVPSINTPVFKADTSNIDVRKFEYPKYTIGSIPGTSLPSVVDLDEAVSHHMALIGVTGSGKSFLAREIIDEISVDTKIICIDFNDEFISELSQAPIPVVSNSDAKDIAANIQWIIGEREKWPKDQSKSEISKRDLAINTNLQTEIEKFLDRDGNNVGVFELPDVSNTTGILDYTKRFFRAIFEVARDRQQKGTPAKICVVLEEAHTIVPEWNFAGTSDKTSQSLVNSIGQIALQGRKYGIGFLVIAQRTANVSKTVLTQCNTVVCFQAFDETSFNFLGNYVGKDIVQTLPNLKKYHAIVAGKAVESNMPLIVDLTRPT